MPWQRRSVAVRAEARRTEQMMIAMSRDGYVEKFGRSFLIALVGEVCCWYCVCVWARRSTRWRKSRRRQNYDARSCGSKRSSVSKVTLTYRSSTSRSRR